MPFKNVNRRYRYFRYISKITSQMYFVTSKSNFEKYSKRRCQPSRNRAGNPAFLLVSRIPAFLLEHPAFLALFRNDKNC